MKRSAVWSDVGGGGSEEEGFGSGRSCVRLGHSPCYCVMEMHFIFDRRSRKEKS